jgi:hypothetical protein
MKRETGVPHGLIGPEIADQLAAGAVDIELLDAASTPGDHLAYRPSLQVAGVHDQAEARVAAELRLEAGPGACDDPERACLPEKPNRPYDGPACVRLYQAPRGQAGNQWSLEKAFEIERQRGETWDKAPVGAQCDGHPARTLALFSPWPYHGAISARSATQAWRTRCAASWASVSGRHE